MGDNSSIDVSFFLKPLCFSFDYTFLIMIDLFFMPFISVVRSTYESCSASLCLVFSTSDNPLVVSVVGLFLSCSLHSLLHIL